MGLAGARHPPDAGMPTDLAQVPTDRVVCLRDTTAERPRDRVPRTNVGFLAPA